MAGFQKYQPPEPGVQYDPVLPLMLGNPDQTISYLIEMRRHYLALAATCERMIANVKSTNAKHDTMR